MKVVPLCNNVREHGCVPIHLKSCSFLCSHQWIVFHKDQRILHLIFCVFVSNSHCNQQGFGGRGGNVTLTLIPKPILFCIFSCFLFSKVSLSFSLCTKIRMPDILLHKENEIQIIISTKTLWISFKPNCSKNKPFYYSQMQFFF